MTKKHNKLPRRQELNGNHIPVSGCQTILSLPLPLYPITDRSLSPAWFGGAVYLLCSKKIMS